MSAITQGSEHMQDLQPLVSRTAEAFDNAADVLRHAHAVGMADAIADLTDEAAWMRRNTWPTIIDEDPAVARSYITCSAFSRQAAIRRVAAAWDIALDSSAVACALDLCAIDVNA